MGSSWCTCTRHGWAEKAAALRGLSRGRSLFSFNNSAMAAMGAPSLAQQDLIFIIRPSVGRRRILENNYYSFSAPVPAE